MDSPLSHRALAAIRTSDRKAANVLGITITRDTAALTPRVPSRLLPFRLKWLRTKFKPSPSFVWDIPNPFAYPLPRPADDVQARIEHERRFESVGPLDPITYYDFDPEYDLEEDDYDDLDDDEDNYDGDDNDGDADDEGEDCDFDALDTDDGHLPIDRPLNMPIALPQLLHNVPLRFITSSIDVSPPPSEAEIRVPSPPTLILYPSSESESETETYSDGEQPDKEETSRAGLAAVYNNITEAAERAARKLRRNAQRSRSKVLAILGPEASSAL